MSENLQNQWLIQNNRQFQALKKFLIESEYKGQSELPNRQIQAILESAIIEVQRLQRELDNSNAKIRELENAKPKVEEKQQVAQAKKK
jgi:DNA-binding PadR family transcriptional regulator